MAPFGLSVTIVEPGACRTEFLTDASLRFTAHTVPDYDERRSRLLTSIQERSGKQAGDPGRLADAIVRLAADAKPPLRFVAGSTAIDAIDAKLSNTKIELDKWWDLSVGTDDIATWLPYPSVRPS